MKQYTYSEIFHSIQGEGKYNGILTAWLRFYLCNLSCDGFGQKDPTNPDTYKLPYKDFNLNGIERLEDLPVWKYGCDSSYSWSAKFKHLQHKKTVSEIADEISNCMRSVFNPEGLFHHPKSGEEQHMCFTGGESLMKHAQEAVVEIMREFRSRNNIPKFITFETNGTQTLSDEFVRAFNEEFDDVEVLFSLSPKLFTVAGESPTKAIRPEVVSTYSDILASDGQLKFVVGTDERMWNELEEALTKFKNAGVDYPVYIMPVGATEEAQEAVAGRVADMAIIRGFHVSPRSHVYLWGNKIGV